MSVNTQSRVMEALIQAGYYVPIQSQCTPEASPFGQDRVGKALETMENQCPWTRILMVDLQNCKKPLEKPVLHSLDHPHHSHRGRTQGATQLTQLWVRCKHPCHGNPEVIHFNNLFMASRIREGCALAHAHDAFDSSLHPYVPVATLDLMTILI